MVYDEKQVHELRRELADGLCAAQALPVPRTELQRMLYSLLLTAFAGLDEAAGIERIQAVAIALHALREWRIFAGLGLLGDRPPASASAP
jgi:hypothetical protein